MTDQQGKVESETFVLETVISPLSSSRDGWFLVGSYTSTVTTATAEGLFLIDTGADICWIDSDLVTDINLQIIDKMPIFTPEGVKQEPVYGARLSIQTNSSPYIERVSVVAKPDFSKNYAIALKGASSVPVIGVVGRIFLRDWTLVYTGTAEDLRLYQYQTLFK